MLRSYAYALSFSGTAHVHVDRRCDAAIGRRRFNTCEKLRVFLGC